MANTIKHRKQSVLASAGYDVDVPQWNDSHILDGGTNGQVLIRDNTASDGWNWAATGSAGAPLVSPAFSGVPTAPTAAVNTNTTQLATTAFVFAMINLSPVTVAPIDASGAGLVLGGQIQYVRLGRMVFFTFGTTWPANSNGNVAIVSGLPYASIVQSAGALGYSEVAAAERIFIQVNQAYFQMVPNQTNAQMSGKTIIGSGFYFV